MPLTPISNRCKHYAIFWNDAGVQVGFKKINFKEPVFDYDNRKFNFFPNNSSVWIKKGFFLTRKYYQYNINDPNPLYIKPEIKPEIDSKTHKAIYDNRLIHELCSLADGGFLQFLKKYWWVILIVVAVVWFFSSGQDLSFFTGTSPPPTPTPNITNVRMVQMP